MQGIVSFAARSAARTASSIESRSTSGIETTGARIFVPSTTNNGKPWTLTVKVFGGAMVIQDRTAGNNNKFMDALGLSKGREVLDAGAMQARALA